MENNQRTKHHSHHHKHRHHSHRKHYSRERKSYNNKEFRFILLCMAGVVLLMILLIPLLANFMESL